MDNALIKEVLVTVHSFGAILGFGGSLYAHYFSYFYFEDFEQKIRATHLKVFHSINKFIIAGLVVLWVSGISLLVFYYLYEPHSFWNSKLYVKLFLVVTLTVIGYKVIFVITPELEHRVGQYFIKDLPEAQIASMFFWGGLSVITWFATFILGSFRKINFPVATYKDLLLGCIYYFAPYLLIVLLTFVISKILAHRIYHKHNDKNHVG